MLAVGNAGYNWSSTVNGTYANYLSLGSSWIYPSNANYRACGFQVRCLRE